MTQGTCILPWLSLALLTAGPALCAEPSPVPEMVLGGEGAAAGFIQSAALDPSRPLFIPTHPRVTTTVRFPSAIGAPDGRGFTEDEAKQPGEYLVSWSPGDPHFTLTPLRNAGPLNLNVPYQGSTYVLYFYPVDRQFQAVASLNLEPLRPDSPIKPAAKTDRPIVRSLQPPKIPIKEASPARMLGIIDRLKLISCQPPGPGLAELASQLNVEVAACPPPSSKLDGVIQETARPGGISSWLPRSVTDCGLFELRLLRTMKDPQVNALGFALRVRNRSSQTIAFDLSSFAARTGSHYLPQFISDAPAILVAGEEREAFFAVKCPTDSPLLASNDWHLSVDLISPLLNPGAAFVRDFARDKK